MGLDITAYRNLKPAGPEARDEFGDLNWPGFVAATVNPDFPAHAAPFTDGQAFATDEASTFGFRAGSYSGYGVWRDGLARLAGYSAAHWDGEWNVPESGPFVELVNFSDCEGTIGTTFAAKLAADFAAFQDRADTHENDYWREKYADWRKACEMAADGGLIDFH